MKVRDCMTRKVTICAPHEPIQNVAEKMAKQDCGVIPLAENDKLVGVITDRDIAIRCIAEGKGPDTPANEIMSPEVLYCYDDQDIEAVTDNMAELKVRRMPVVDRDKSLVGILSLGDVAVANGGTSISAFKNISEAGGPHQQEM